MANIQQVLLKTIRWNNIFLLYLCFNNKNYFIMEKEDYVELFRKEFLKLNFALDSYKHKCKANWAVVNSKVHITFDTGNDKDFLRYELGLEEARDFLHDFKKKCIDICSHIKKEAI